MQQDADGKDVNRRVMAFSFRLKSDVDWNYQALVEVRDVQ